jgi:putative heme iron utilization protein
MRSRHHGEPGDAPSVPPPLTPVANDTRPSAAEEARTVAASTNAGTLATLTGNGDPWASLVTYGLLRSGEPVLCVSRLAEHGRNLDRDRRASIAIVGPLTHTDPLAGSRITLAGVADQPTGEERVAAREAHLVAVPAATHYIDFRDFSLWVLRVRRVRWVGGYGRMDWPAAVSYATAEPDPVRPHAAAAIAHLNAADGESLRSLARAFGGYPDTISATCTGADRYGLDLRVVTDRGVADTRVGYPEPISSIDDLGALTKELVRLAGS